MLSMIFVTKVNALVDLIKNILGRDKVTLQELQSLLVRLIFFSKAIRSRRTFIRRMYIAMGGGLKPHQYHHMRLTIRINVAYVFERS